VYPRLSGGKRPLVVLGVVGFLLAGCGGGGGGSVTTTAAGSQAVIGGGFRFDAPAGWTVKRTATSATAAPSGSSQSRVAVYVLSTTKRYRPALWPQAAIELDRSAKQLALSLHGTLRPIGTISVAGDRARQYVIDYAGKHARFTFLFRGRHEYELLCRWSSAENEPSACALLTASFRPA
jgi:hypothetical protein